MTETAREERETWLVSRDGWTPGQVVQQLRAAIRRKVEKFDRGAYAQPCELAVYNNTDDALDDEVVKCVKDPGLLGRFEAVHLVDCDGTRVYADVLGDVPERIDIAAEYDIDLVRWAQDQIDFLRQRKLERTGSDSGRSRKARKTGSHGTETQAIRPKNPGSPAPPGKSCDAHARTA